MKGGGILAKLMSRIAVKTGARWPKQEWAKVEV